MKLNEFLTSVVPLGRSMLQPHHSEMLVLRERGYSIAQVRAFLLGNGVKASLSNVAAYLRRHPSLHSSPQAQPAVSASDVSRVAGSGAAPVPTAAATSSAFQPALSMPSASTTPALAPSASTPSAQATPAATQTSPLLRTSKFESWDPRGIDYVLQNPPDMEALRLRGLELARANKLKRQADAKKTP
jgi:hypothetical protein